LRKQWGDDRRQPRLIETVPTIGYRFIASVVEQTASDMIVGNFGRDDLKTLQKMS
jgi:DNA-binding winged helix-turn-helix (wHTH) protein